MSNNIPYIIILIFLVLISLVLLIGIYFYGMLDNLYRMLNITPLNNYEKFVFDNKQMSIASSDLTSDKSLQKQIQAVSPDDSSGKNNSTIAVNINKDDQKNPDKMTRNADNRFVKSGAEKRSSAIKGNYDGVYGKGSNVKDFDFHSYGEYVSDDEKNYRIYLIKNLKIKTIVVNSVTKGNGISQEYYKIAYLTKMIPAKILDVLVESREFRELIPMKYRSKEFTTNGFKKGESVQFKNIDIIRLLNDWSIGKLTPVSKAWKVKAEK